MRMLERVLIIMSFMGYYLAIWRRPADYSLLFVSIAALSVLYILAMPMLLYRSASTSAGRTAVRHAFRRQYLIPGYLFGVLSAYCVFGLTYHSLKRMDSIALVENCGIFLLLFAIYDLLRFRKSRDAFYRQMLIRIAVFAVLICISLLLRPLPELHLSK